MRLHDEAPRPSDVDTQDYMGELVLGGEGSLARAKRDDDTVTLQEMVRRGAAAQRLLRALRQGGAR